MTYKSIATWKPLGDVMSIALGERVKYVRENLRGPDRRGRRKAYLTHDEFAEILGTEHRATVIGWEKGRHTPRDYAEQIAALTPYPAAAFGAPGEAELVRECLGSRLRVVEEETRWLRSQLLRCLAALQLEPQVEEPTVQSGGALR